MAFQVGIIKIKGCVDGLSFYGSPWGWLVRKKGGPTREQFKTSPRFERSRENSSEFAGSSLLAHAAWTALRPYAGRGNKRLYNRLMKLMCALRKEDLVSARGQRTAAGGLLSEGGRRLAALFDLHPCNRLRDVLQAGSTGRLSWPEGADQAEVRVVRVWLGPHRNQWDAGILHTETLSRGQRYSLWQPPAREVKEQPGIAMHVLQVSFVHRESNGFAPLPPGTGALTVLEMYAVPAEAKRPAASSQRNAKGTSAAQHGSRTGRREPAFRYRLTRSRSRRCKPTPMPRLEPVRAG